MMTDSLKHPTEQEAQKTERVPESIKQSINPAKCQQELHTPALKIRMQKLDTTTGGSPHNGIIFGVGPMGTTPLPIMIDEYPRLI